MLSSQITLTDIINAKEGENYQFKEAKNRFVSPTGTHSKRTDGKTKNSGGLSVFREG